MLIMLPTSAGKARGKSGKYDPARLSHPALNPARARVWDALVATAARPDALDILHAGPKVADQVADMLTLADQPVSPAAQIFTGVLYEAAHLERAATNPAVDVRIVSALFGLLSPADPIPAYRLGMTAPLPGLPALASLWRPLLQAELDALEPEFIVDCCSEPYRKAWAPRYRGAPICRVSAKRKTARGYRAVSHWVKHYRGVVTDALARWEGTPPATADELADAVRTLGCDVLVEPGEISLVVD